MHREARVPNESRPLAIHEGSGCHLCCAAVLADNGRMNATTAQYVALVTSFVLAVLLFMWK